MAERRAASSSGTAVQKVVGRANRSWPAGSETFKKGPDELF